MTTIRAYATVGPYDQFGEHSILTHILDRLGGPRFKRCAEFGAGDGFDCAVTLILWRQQGWTADLIEADSERFGHLQRFVVQACDGPSRREAKGTVWATVHERSDGGPVTTAHTTLTAGTVNDLIAGDYDVVSIDVDGPDYHLWEAMECEPRVVCIERNHTIPWWIDVRQANEDAMFGASAAALNRLGNEKGYRLVFSAGPNLFFVREDDADVFGSVIGPGAPSFEEVMAEAETFEPTVTYMASDYTGRRRLFGAPCPWGHLPEPCDYPLIEGPG